MLNQWIAAEKIHIFVVYTYGRKQEYSEKYSYFYGFKMFLYWMCINKNTVYT